MARYRNQAAIDAALRDVVGAKITYFLSRKSTVGSLKEATLRLVWLQPAGRMAALPVRYLPRELRELLRAREDDCIQNLGPLTQDEHEVRSEGRKSMLGEKEVSRVRTPWM